MNTRICASFVLLAITGLTAGCASQEITESGYLGDHAWSTEDSNEKTLVTTLDSTTIRRYETLYVEPTQFVRSARTERISQDDASTLTAVMTDALKNEFAAHFTIVETPDDGTLLVRSAITDVAISNAAVNVLSTGLLFAPLDNGGATAEIELVDHSSGRLLGGMITWENGSPAQFRSSFNRIGHATHVIDEVVERFVSAALDLSEEE